MLSLHINHTLTLQPMFANRSSSKRGKEGTLEDTNMKHCLWFGDTVRSAHKPACGASMILIL